MDLEKIQQALFLECQTWSTNVLDTRAESMIVRMLEANALRKVINRIKTNKYE